MKAGRTPEDRLQVLIVTGIVTSEHDPGISRMLRRMLESTGRFDVRITEEFRGATDETLAPYDLVLLNYDGKKTVHDPAVPLGAMAEQAILDHVEAGGGLVFYHSAVFLEAWPMSFCRLIGGLFDFSAGSRKTPYSDFLVRIHGGHPVTDGLDSRMPLVNDDLFVMARWDPDAQIELLAEVHDDIDGYSKIPLHMAEAYREYPLESLHGIGTDIPVVWTNRCGEGRVFTVTIGHGIDTLRRPAFVALLCRGAEWAAAGVVTLHPPDLANENRFRAWPYYSALTIQEMAALV